MIEKAVELAAKKSKWAEGTYKILGTPTRQAVNGFLYKIKFEVEEHNKPRVQYIIEAMYIYNVLKPEELNIVPLKSENQ